MRNSKEAMEQFLKSRKFAIDSLFNPIDEKLKYLSGLYNKAARSYELATEIARIGGFTIETKTETQRIAEEKAVRLQEEIDAIKDALNSLCGAILQIARHSIVYVFEKEDKVPKEIEVRITGKKYPLDKVLRYSRNQAIHSEEGKIKNAETKAFFEDISLSNEEYKDFHTQNKAMYIIEALEWFNVSDFEKSLLALCE